MTDVVDFVKSKRNLIGLSQSDFAKYVGVSDASLVEAWENGSKKPTPAKMRTIDNIVEPPFKNSDNRFTFIDLFAGIGGFRIPFQDAGGECVFSSEWDKFSQKVYAENFGDYPQGDITKIDVNDIPAHDILLGGFPCQAFSHAGKKQGFHDTRGTLFFDVQRILAHHRPKAFVLENVKGLVSHRGGKTLETIINVLTETGDVDIPDDVELDEKTRKDISKGLGYHVSVGVINAVEHGVPQKRERLFIVGIDPNQVDVGFEDFDFFQNIKPIDVEDRKTLKDVLITNDEVDEKYTISDIAWQWHKDRLALNQAKGYGFGYSLFTHDDEYGNTLSARYHKDGNEFLVCQKDVGKNPRKLTPRECARLQGFPEEFIIDGVSDTQSYTQFGNSVAVPVIRSIAEQLIKLF